MSEHDNGCSCTDCKMSHLLSLEIENEDQTNEIKQLQAELENEKRLHAEILDKELGARDTEIARLKDEISGCILRMDDGDFPDKDGVTELERKLDECCRNNDSEIDRLKEKLRHTYGEDKLDDFPTADQADMALNNLSKALKGEPHD